MASLAETFFRAGFVAKAVVYLSLGGLAVLAAFGRGGRVTNAHGVILAIAGERDGRVWAGVLAAGLAAYALWRFAEAFFDANHRGSGARALLIRAGYAASCFVHTLLAVDAANVAWGLPLRDGTDTGVQTLAGRLAGAWGVPLIAVGLIGYAAQEASKAARGKLSDQLNERAAAREAGGWVLLVARGGVIARAAVFALVGVILLRGSGAVESDTSDSLRLLAALPYGRWWLAAAGAGLFAYGILQLVQARYRRVNPP